MRTSILLTVILSVLILSCCNNKQEVKKNGALEALQYYSSQRTFPFKKMPGSGFYDAYDHVVNEFRLNNQLRNDGKPWEAIGPWNTAGRMLCLAIHPQQPNTIWAGSASGGLWRTDEFGIDTSWYRVETGHPVSGVSALALAPNDNDVVLIGTGEVYNYERSGDGAAYRSTRGTPGIGILRSDDGGKSWSLVLNWAKDQNRGVNAIAFAESDSRVVYSATTEGVYQSFDGGKSWEQSLNVPMAMDIVVDPNNPNMAIVGCGNFNTPNKGIYWTGDGGETWNLSTGEVPDFNGKIRLDYSKNKSGLVYASVGNGFSTSGGMATWTLKSIDGGRTWEEISTVDYSRWQGWFAHDIAVHPKYPDTIIGIGIYIHKSEKSGQQFEQITRNPQVTSGRPSVMGPDGPQHYTHVDHHAVIYHPTKYDTVIVASDGGVFISRDGGENWESRNGGLQTTQFYNGISISPNRPDWVLGGLQDNNSVHFDGDMAWTRILGGDGSWSAIDPQNDNVFFASYQWLNIFKSTERGANFQRIFGTSNDDNPTFIAPFVLHPKQSNVLYAASNFVYVTYNQGSTWERTNGGLPIHGSDPIISMDVAPSDIQTVYVGTAPFSDSSSVWVTLNGGDSWERIGEGVLPNRYPVDIAVDPKEKGKAIVTFSGYGSGHVFITQDHGSSWNDITANLPDVPTNAAAIDAEHNGTIYIGNDLGVFYSQNEGKSWNELKDGLPEVVVVSDLKLSNITDKLVLATHGNGMYMTDLITPITTSLETLSDDIDFFVYPTILKDDDIVTLEIKSQYEGTYYYRWVQLSGIYTPLVIVEINKSQDIQFDFIEAGTYYLQVLNQKRKIVKSIPVVKL